MIKKIIFINFIIIVLILCIVEFLSFQTYKNRYKDLLEAHIKNCENPEECRKEMAIKYKKVKRFNYENLIHECLNKVYTGNKKGGIVTIGCSYTEGAGLKEEQTFAYKLNKYTGRTTYNRGVSGSGPQMVYRQLSDKNFKNEVPAAGYIIYTFIFDHLGRQFRPLLSYESSDLEIIYKLNNKNQLIEINHPCLFFYSSYITKTISEYVEHKELDNFFRERNYKLHDNKMYKLFLKTMEESVKTMKKDYPDAKFVLLEVPQGEMYTMPLTELRREEIKDIEKLGIIYINAEELVGHQLRDTEKYRMPDKDHPNERVWDEIVPSLAKKLNL